MGGVSGPYGRTGFQMEEICDHVTSNPSFRAGVLRYFNPIGSCSVEKLVKILRVLFRLIPFVYGVAIGQRNKLQYLVQIISRRCCSEEIISM